MSAKRVRVVETPRAGVLQARWGRANSYDTPSIIYAWGAGGADKSDARILSDAFERPRWERDFDKPNSFSVAMFKEGPSLAAELEARGYDLTTLRFTIERKQP